MKTADPGSKSGFRGALTGFTTSTSSASVNSDQDARSYGTIVAHPAGASEQNQLKKWYDDIPPPDTGRAAWFFLIGCFWLEALVWGMSFSFPSLCLPSPAESCRSISPVLWRFRALLLAA